MDGRKQESSNISQGRMIDIKSVGTEIWTVGKGKIQDIWADGVTHGREGAERKNHFSLDLYPLWKLQY